VTESNEGIRNTKDLRRYIFSTQKQAYYIFNEDYTYEPIIDPLESDLGILKYSNANIFNNKENFNPEDCIVIEDNVCLLEVFPHYYHFIVDVLGKFLYINKFVPKTIPYIFLFNHSSLQWVRVDSLNRKSFKGNFESVQFVEDILESIKEKFPNSVISQKELSNIPYIFNNLYTVDPHSISANDLKLTEHNLTQNSPIASGLQHYKTIIDLLRETFLPNRESKQNRNIFVTRSDNYKRSITHIKELENFMQNNGYEIINPDHLTFKEQIETFYDAKNIVALSASSLTNTIWADKKVNIVNIPTQFNYQASEWRMFAYFLNLNYLEFYIDADQIDLIIKNLSRLEYIWD
jgi:hypothetical protein